MELQPIKVESEWTNNLDVAQKWLNDIKGPVACDFEVALKYKKRHLEEIQREYDIIHLDKTKFSKTKELQAKLKATALSHPSYCYITHFSFAETEDTGKVILTDNQDLARLVLTWLINTDVKQIWHNASFDFRHIYYHTNKFPKNYEDTQIASKCLLNHVEIFKAKTGLKDLMGRYYGQWAVSADNFTRENIYDKNLIHYAAIDAAATYKLWNEIQQYVDTSEKEKL